MKKSAPGSKNGICSSIPSNQDDTDKIKTIQGLNTIVPHRCVHIMTSAATTKHITTVMVTPSIAPAIFISEVESHYYSQLVFIF